MWKPASPIVITGQALTDQEAWWHEFRNELEVLAEGSVDSAWLTMVCRVVYPIAFKDDPRYIARLAYAVFALERPQLGRTMHRARMRRLRSNRRTFCRRPRR
ncbi:hypothetical protein J2W27_000321 [Variovorax boronicumulans]|uniref:hypothetical protein n=1 Tax=Variovorax boronicumulans TaxID=436515 RepID=UPI00277D61F8|nr:hypothetical protein [Variovorax boronicumulans]MDP9908228.1 hypothetical protein [Variovorax boronicumulans]